METVIYASFLVLFGILLNAEAYTVNDTEILHNNLFATYSKKFRPSSQTHIRVSFGLMHITELDIVSQRLHCVGFLTTMWVDERLKWSSSLYGDMTHSYGLVSDIWTPPLVLTNAADEIKLLNDNSDFASNPIAFMSMGIVIWMTPANFIAQCTINIKYYPFDSQSCDVFISSWLYTKFELDLFATDTEINTDIFKENGEWDITGSSIENVTRILSGYQLPSVKFTVHLTRKYSYYLLNMLLPVIVLATMAPFVFILPVESGEKNGFALTILLSLSVVMTIVSDNIPPTSNHICILSVYLLVTFIVCSVITVVTVVTCRLHELHNKEYIMSERCQTTAKILAKITRYQRRPKNGEEQTAYDKPESVVAVKLPEKLEMSKKSRKDSTAWTEDSLKSLKAVDTVETEYTYEDIVIMYETFNFVLFTILTILVTCIFMIVLNAGF